KRGIGEQENDCEPLKRIGSDTAGSSYIAAVRRGRVWKYPDHTESGRVLRQRAAACGERYIQRFFKLYSIENFQREPGLSNGASAGAATGFCRDRPGAGCGGF